MSWIYWIVVTYVEESGSNLRTGGAGLVPVTFLCFDPEYGSWGTSDLRLLAVVPFVASSVCVTESGCLETSSRDPGECGLVCR